MPESRRKSSGRRASVTAYDRQRAKAKLRSATITLAGQDIAPLSPCKHPTERHRADGDFRYFCERYFHKVFDLAWSPDHLRVIQKIERVVRNRETYAVAMPRGSGKTSLCLAAVEWAILGGHHGFVYLVASTNEAAVDLLAKIKAHFERNALLMDDYPEALEPIWRLDGESRRCTGQRYYGIPTRIEWGLEEIVMPTMPNSPASGAVIRVSGLTGNIRGALHVRPDGTSVRPSLVICDDPQTDQSARSALQTAERLSLITGAIAGLAGPGKRTAIIVPCTVIRASDLADQLLDRQRHPEWHGERTKMLNAFPTNERLWSEYAKLRAESLRVHDDIRLATVFYREHREEMDAGAVAAWPERFLENELSAIQHAMNLKLQDEAAFASEYQNEPIQDQLAQKALTPAEVAGRFNGRPRGEVPLPCSTVTMFVDVHDRVLYWCVAAWQQDFTGYVIDYGTWPYQNRAWFDQDTAPYPLAKEYPAAGVDGAIQSGLEALVGKYLSHEWPRAGGGGVLRVEKCLVDMGYKPGIVAAVKHKVGGAAMVLAKGVGIRAGGRPMSMYRRKPGEVHGHNWYFPNVRGTQEFPHVAVDVNWWKTFVHGRLVVASGDPGALTLYGKSADQHGLFAAHVAGSETWTVTQGYGRYVQEWKLNPARPDNHWLDCLVGCAVAASICGVRLPGLDAQAARERKPIRLSALRGGA
jgi:hypothetical protein